MSQKRVSKILSTGILEVFHNHGYDFYHDTLKLSPLRFIGIFIAVFLSLNAFFGFLYYFFEGSITGPHLSSYLECFSFSVQTMGTVGYGTFYPSNTLAHLLTTIEVMIGLVGIGTFAALVFARISLPSSKLVVSNKLLINDDDGHPSLMFRVAHLRQNVLVNVDISLQMLCPKKSPTGQIEMVMQGLELEKDFYHVLTGAWLIKHPITQNSPIFEKSSVDLRLQHCSLIATITGTDGTTSEAVNHVYSYTSDDIIWYQRFTSMIEESPETGEYLVNHTKINNTESSKYPPPKPSLEEPS